jgi:hypothetical protein
MFNLTWLKLVFTAGGLDCVESGACGVVEGCAGVEDVVAGSDGDAAVVAQGLDEFLDAPSGGLFEPTAMARAANTMLRWASIDSRLWW